MRHAFNFCKTGQLGQLCKRNLVAAAQHCSKHACAHSLGFLGRKTCLLLPGQSPRGCSTRTATALELTADSADDVQAKGHDILKHPQRAQSAATMQEVVQNTAAIRQGQADAEQALQVTHLLALRSWPCDQADSGTRCIAGMAQPIMD